ncbi:hypothetical protein LX36DRAFT_752836 [Colletotrichum falcatum]|nr:hypothetical protein LX36DRAFT_752836 [Colletotrichum falcatum]
MPSPLTANHFPTAPNRPVGRHVAQGSPPSPPSPLLRRAMPGPANEGGPERGSPDRRRETRNRGRGTLTREDAMPGSGTARPRMSPVPTTYQGGPIRFSSGRSARPSDDSRLASQLLQIWKGARGVVQAALLLVGAHQVAAWIMAGGSY